MLHLLLPRFLRVMHPPACAGAGGSSDVGRDDDDAVSALKASYSVHNISGNSSSPTPEQEVRRVQWLPDFVAVPGAFPLPDIGLCT